MSHSYHFPIWQKLLCSLYDDFGNHSASNVGRKLGISSNTVCLVIKILDEKQLIVRVKEGRQHRITLTSKGKKLVESLKEVGIHGS